MEQKSNRCQFKRRQYLDYRCHEPSLADSKENYCIFHERRDSKDSHEFQAKIERKIRNEDYDFTGFYFSKQIDFSHRIFCKNVAFYGAIFKEKTSFERAKFKAGVNFFGAEFKAEANFQEAEFEPWAEFLGVKFKGARFGGAKFKRADFRGVRFEEEVGFYGAEFKAEADFSGAEFKKGVTWGGVKFDDVCFSCVTFSYQLFFAPSIIKTKIDLSLAMLENVSLAGLNLEPNACIDFREARLFRSQLRKKDIEGHIFQEKNKNFLEAKDIYVVLKNNFHSLGDYDGESWAFRKEKEMERKSFWYFRKEYKGQELGEKWINKGIKDCFYPILSDFEYTAKYLQDYLSPTSWKKINRLFSCMVKSFQHPIANTQNEFKKFVFFVVAKKQKKIEKMSCKELFKALWFYIKFPIKYFWSTFLKYLYGWGEWPWLILAWCVATIFIFSGLYCLIGDITSTTNSTIVKSYGEKLYFSGITFTTLGFGGYSPMGWAKVLAFIESFLGIFSIALFVYSFARRTAGR